MKKALDEILKRLIENRNLNSDIEYDTFINSLEVLREINKIEIENPIDFLKKLFEILKSDTDDFQTLMDICFYIFEFEIENIISVEEFVNIIFTGIDFLKVTHTAWAETFIILLFKEKFLGEVKSKFLISDNLIKNLFKNEALRFINNKTNNNAIKFSKEIINFLDASSHQFKTDE